MGMDIKGNGITFFDAIKFSPKYLTEKDLQKTVDFNKYSSFMKYRTKIHVKFCFSTTFTPKEEK